MPHACVLLATIGVLLAHRLTQLAGYAALLAGGVPPQDVFPPEAGTDLALLKGVVDLQQAGVTLTGRLCWLSRTVGVSRAGSLSPLLTMQFLAMAKTARAVCLLPDGSALAALVTTSAALPAKRAEGAAVLTVTLGSKKVLRVSSRPLAISVRKRVCALSSRTADGTRDLVCSTKSREGICSRFC